MQHGQKQHSLVGMNMFKYDTFKLAVILGNATL